MVQRTIRLFESADETTFPHEVVHVFLQEIRSLVASGDKDIIADWMTLIDVAGWDEKQKSFKDEEKIAQMFELYLYEGKAPSVKLAGAFAMMRKWLIAVYHAVTTYMGADAVSPELRGVFDRLLASESEIEQAKSFYSAKQSYVSLFPKMAKKVKDKLLKKKELADDEALNKQVERHFNAFKKAHGGRAELRKDAANIIDESTTYKAINDILEGGGLSREYVVKHYGAEYANQLFINRRGLLTEKEKAVALGEIAAKYETTEEELLKDIVKAPSREQAITDKTNELEADLREMFKRELSAEETTPGDEAFHGDARLALLIAESELLRAEIERKERRQEARLEQKAITAAAEAVIGQSIVRDATKYSKWAFAEQKYSKLAMDALEQGDLLKAHEYKKLQIMNHALILQSVKMREKMAKIEKTYRASAIRKRTEGAAKEKARVEITYRNAMYSLIQAFELTTSEAFKRTKSEAFKRTKSEAIAPDEVLDKSGVAIDPIQAVREIDQVWYDRNPSWINSRSKPDNFTNWKDLTVEQFSDLHEAIKALEHAGSNALLAITDKRFKTTDQLADAAKAQMVKNGAKYKPDDRTFAGKFLNKFESLMESGNIMSFVAGRIDGFTDSGVGQFGPFKTMLNFVRAAEGKFHETRNGVYDKAKPHWETLYQASGRLQKQFGAKLFPLPDVEVSEVQAREGHTLWSVEQMIAVVLNMGSETNREALQDGYAYTAEDVDNIAAYFTAEELQAIQGIWDATDTLFEPYDQTYFNVYNRRLMRVPAKEFAVRTKSGTVVEMKGGYYPLKYDPELSATAAKLKAAKDDELSLMQRRHSNAFKVYYPPRGATHERTPGHGLPVKLTTATWLEHLNDVSRYISHAEIMQDLNKVTLDPEWAQLVKDTEGTRIYQQIRDWVSYQALPERNIPDGFWGRALEKQRSAATAALLTMRAAVGLKQRLSSFTAIREVGLGEFLSAARDTGWRTSLYGSTKTAQWDNILNLSTYMKIRQRAVDRDVYDSVNQFNPAFRDFSFYGRRVKLKDIQDFMFEWIQLNDRATVAITWKAGFNKAFRENETNKSMTAEERADFAVKKADDLVEQTQPSGLPMDLSKLQRAEGPVRLFTLFMTWQIKSGAVYRKDFQMWKKGKISTGEYMRKFMYHNLAGPIGAVIIQNLIAGEMPEWWEFLTAPFTSAVGWIPVAREIEGAVRYGRRMGESPVFEGANRLIDLGEDTFKAVTDDGDWARVVWDIARVIAWQTKLPILNVVSDLMRLQRNIEEGN